MNIKKAHIDSINLMSEGFEDLFENDNYHIEIIKAKGIYSPSRYKSEFGQKLKRNLSEVKVIHTSRGLSIPLKRLANNNLKQIIEFGGLSGYLERSQLLQEFFKNVIVEMEDGYIEQRHVSINQLQKCSSNEEIRKRIGGITVDELRIKIEQLIEDLENETKNRNMNDLEEGRYKALCEVLDLIDEQKK